MTPAPSPATSVFPRLRWDWNLDGIAISSLALLHALMFWPVVFAGAFVPRGGGDLVSFIYPRYAFVARSVRSGVLPLWDPYLYGGQPYLADIQSGLLYPLNLLAFVIFRNFDYRKLEVLANVRDCVWAAPLTSTKPLVVAGVCAAAVELPARENPAIRPARIVLLIIGVLVSG